MRFINFSAIQVIGFLFLVTAPFYLNDLFQGQYEQLFNKLATLAALSALVISILNEASTNSKIHIQNVRNKLETKLGFILRQFDLITFDFSHPTNLPGTARGFHAFRVVMGDLLAANSLVNRNRSTFAFWEAQIVLNHINNYLDDVIGSKAELMDQYATVSSHSLDCIKPILHVYQEFYNHYLSLNQRGVTASPELTDSMSGIYTKMNEIGPKYQILKGELTQ